MTERSDYLQQMAGQTGHVVEDGYSREEISEIFAAAARLVGLGELPYARGTCVNRGAVQVA